MTITIQTLQTGLNKLQNGLSTLIANNPIASVGVAAGSGLIAGGVLGSTITKKKKKKSKSKTKRSKKRTSKLKYRNKRKKSGRKTPRTAGKRKDRSSKRIRYTKKGQPYVLMKSGKARFIKKSSAKSSHKRKGGRY